jgi:hypothetical protein
VHRVRSESREITGLCISGNFGSVTKVLVQITQLTFRVNEFYNCSGGQTSTSLSIHKR